MARLGEPPTVIYKLLTMKTDETITITVPAAVAIDCWNALRGYTNHGPEWEKIADQYVTILETALSKPAN